MHVCEHYTSGNASNTYIDSSFDDLVPVYQFGAEFTVLSWDEFALLGGYAVKES